MLLIRKTWLYWRFSMKALEAKSKIVRKDMISKFMMNMVVDGQDDTVSYFKFGAHYEEQLAALKRGEKTYPINNE